MIHIEIGSLFSGIGGIELGFEREGFKTKWFVENNLYCKFVLKKNFPHIQIYDDITKLEWDKLPKVDILTGGFPCQDISNAGKRKGIAGERSSLWKYYAKGIREVQPKYAVIENVSAITLRGLNVVLADLAENGYDAEWFSLRASDFGAIHRRERIFIIAYTSSIRHFGCKNKKERCQRITCAQDGRVFVPRIITDDWYERIQRFRQESLQGEFGFSWCKDVRRIEDLKGRHDIPEPLFCGGRDGISNWMDRIASCGNAVVPQVAQFIARIIKEKEKGGGVVGS